jgi:hypothetical protein
MTFEHLCELYIYLPLNEDSIGITSKEFWDLLKQMNSDPNGPWDRILDIKTRNGRPEIEFLGVYLLQIPNNWTQIQSQ